MRFIDGNARIRGRLHIVDLLAALILLSGAIAIASFALAANP